VWDVNHPDLADWKVQSTPEDHRRHRSPARLASACFIVSEAMFFLLLVSAYIVFNRKTEGGSSASRVLEVGRTGFFTILLLASSVTLWRAERALRGGDRLRFLRWLGFTLALGAIFLINQASEYVGLLRKGVTINSSLFGSTFFTVTGFHGLHVLAGLVVLGIFYVLGRRGLPGERQAHAFGAVGYYWHFVDVVWIVVFSVIYLRVLT
jgi:heme/copper-type cytochrome/quinol oxidase subunit 3